MTRPSFALSRYFLSQMSEDASWTGMSWACIAIFSTELMVFPVSEKRSSVDESVDGLFIQRGQAEHNILWCAVWVMDPHTHSVKTPKTYIEQQVIEVS